MKKRFLCFTVLITVAFTIAACDVKPSPTVDTRAERNIYLTLVNQTHELPNNWQNKVNIDEVENSCGEISYVEEETYEQFKLLQGEVLAKGIQVEINSAFRTVDEQKQAYDDSVSKYGEEYTKKHCALPGYSEDQTGLAIDIFIIKNDQEIRENSEILADTEDIAEIHEALPEYGFILSHPKGKEDITGYSYEPWHIRYVGDTVIATEIMEENITLEEYLGE